MQKVQSTPRSATKLLSTIHSFIPTMSILWANTILHLVVRESLPVVIAWRLGGTCSHVLLLIWYLSRLATTIWWAVNFAHDLLSSVTEWAILITTRNLVWIVHRTAIGLLWLIVVGAKGVFTVINALVSLWDWLRNWSLRIVLYLCFQPFVLWANSIHGHSKWW